MTSPDQWVLVAACGCPIAAAPAATLPAPGWTLAMGYRIAVVRADRFRREVLPALTAPCPHGSAEAPPPEVDADARHAMVLSQALGEIATVSPGTQIIAAGWLRGELPALSADFVAAQLYALPEHLTSARDVVLVAVRNRADRHAAQSESDGTQ